MFCLFPSFKFKKKKSGHFVGHLNTFLSHWVFIELSFFSQLDLTWSLQGSTFQLLEWAWLVKALGWKGDGFSCANGRRASGGCLCIASVLTTRHFLSGPSAAFWSRATTESCYCSQSSTWKRSNFASSIETFFFFLKTWLWSGGAAADTLLN